MAAKYMFGWAAVMSLFGVPRAYDFKGEVKDPINAFKYECRPESFISGKNILFHITEPDTYEEKRMETLMSNLNFVRGSNYGFTRLGGRVFNYCNKRDCTVDTNIHYVANTRPLPPPPYEDTLYYYSTKAGSHYLSTFHRSPTLLNYTPSSPNMFRVHVVIADTKPFVRTRDYCVGSKFFSCPSMRSKFYYEGELQLALRKEFHYGLYVVIASEKVYFPWLEFIRKMQLPSAVVLRYKAIMHNPTKYLVETAKKMICRAYLPGLDGVNSVMYTMSVMRSFPALEYPEIAEDAVIPHLVIALPMQMEQPFYDLARPIFGDHMFLHALGYIYTRYPSMIVDFLLVDTEKHKLIPLEMLDPTKPNLNSYVEVRDFDRTFMNYCKPGFTRLMYLEDYLEDVKSLIKKKTVQYPQHTIAPVVVAFMDYHDASNFTHPYLIKKLRNLGTTLARLQGHLALISVNNEKTMMFGLQRDTNLELSVMPVKVLPIHTMTDILHITNLHVQKQLAKVNHIDYDNYDPLDEKAIVSLEAPYTNVYASPMDILVVLPAKLTNPAMLDSATDLLKHNLFTALNYFIKSLKPSVINTGIAQYETLAADGQKPACTVLKPMTHTLQRLEIKGAPTPEGETTPKPGVVDPRDCYNKTEWSDGSFRFAIFFVDELGPEQFAVAKKASSALAEEYVGTTIIVAQSIHKDVKEDKDSKMFIADARFCPNLQECILDKMWASEEMYEDVIL